MTATAADANGTITPAQRTGVIHNNATSFTVTPNSGYVANVTGCNGSLLGTGPSYTYTTGPITAACTVTASFANPSGYTVTATAGPNGTISPTSRTAVTHGTTTTFTVTPTVGYTPSVSGCGASLSGTGPSYTYTTGAITADCAITASFNRYTVTATAGANGTISPASQNVAGGATATLTVTPSPGYTAIVVSACGGNLSGTTYTTGPVNADCAISATFAQQTHTVTASATGSGSISPTPQTVAHNGTATFTVTPNSGYTASVGGTCGGTLSGNTYTTSAITNDCTVLASFTQGFTVTATAGANGSISPATQSVANNATTSFTVTPNSGYTATVSGCNGNLSGNTYFTGPITANCTVTASFSQPTYPVTATAGANGSISPAVQNAAYGATTSFTVTPNAGYAAMVTSTCGGSLAGNTFTTGPIATACAVAANFVQPTYTVSATAGANGSISPATQSAAPGATATLTVIPNAGYAAIVTSSCGGSLSGNTFTTAPVNAACAVNANFTQQSYAVTATVGANGSVSPSSQSVAPGTTALLTVIPNAGYAPLVTSTCGGTLTGNIYTTGAVNAACTVNATFTRNTHSYTVTASAEPGAPGSISPFAQTIREGYTAMLIVTPEAGYGANVTGSCGGILAGNVYTTNPVAADCEVIASFTPKVNDAYTVMTAGAGLHGDISPAAQTVSHGQVARFSVFPDIGYFASVSGCGGALAGSMYVTEPVTADCTVTASFSESPALTTPALTLPGAPGAIMGVPYGVLLTVSGGQPPYTYDAVGLPAGLRLDPDGVLSGAPTQSGTFNARITVTDALGQTGQRDYVLTVAADLALTTSRLAEGLVNTAYHQVLQAIGGRPPYRYQAEGLPVGLTLDAKGILSGIPMARGDAAIQITLSDTEGQSVTQMLALTVRDATFTRPNPVKPEQAINTAITPPPGATCDVASTETYTLNLGDPGAPTAGPDGVDLPYGLLRIVVRGCTAGQTVLAFTTVYPQPLPPGTQYWKYGRTADNPTPHWYVMPGAIVEGNSVTFLIVDGGIGDDDLKVDANITDPGGPGLPNLRIGGTVAASSPLSQPYRATLQARYGSSPSTLTARAATPATEAPYLWSVIDGVLPPGLTLDGAAGEAVLSGTPTRSGTYPFTLQVIDRNRDNTLTQQPYVIEITGGDAATTLILHYYTSILGREPEPDGLAFWQGQIAESQAAGADVKAVFREMANFFFNSPEYLGQNTTNVQFLFDLYGTFFQREPDEEGLEFWWTQLLDGVPRNDVMAGFLYSPEFTDFMVGLGL